MLTNAIDDDGYSEGLAAEVGQRLATIKVRVIVSFDIERNSGQAHMDSIIGVRPAITTLNKC